MNKAVCMRLIHSDHVATGGENPRKHEGCGLGEDAGSCVSSTHQVNFVKRREDELRFQQEREVLRLAMSQGSHAYSLT